MNPDDTQNVVSGSPLTTMLASAGRWLIALIGTYLVSHGYVGEGSLPMIAIVLTVLGTVGYGLVKSYLNRKHLIFASASASNAIAVVTGAASGYLAKKGYSPDGQDRAPDAQSYRTPGT